jgi:hypothetical protein
LYFLKICFLFVDDKINDQKAKGKKKNQGSRGENIYKDNNNNSLLGLMQRIKFEWKLLLPPQTNTNFLPTIKANMQIK